MNEGVDDGLEVVQVRLVVHGYQQGRSSHMPMCRYVGAVRVGPWASNAYRRCNAVQCGVSTLLGSQGCYLGTACPDHRTRWL